MTGMARTTGAALDGADHIRQSMADILATPIGTRVGRRDYGSLVPELIDQPVTGANILRLYAATAVALARWEDRARLRRVSLVAGDRPGAGQLTIDAERLDVAPVRRVSWTFPTGELWVPIPQPAPAKAALHFNRPENSQYLPLI